MERNQSSDEDEDIDPFESPDNIKAKRGSSPVTTTARGILETHTSGDGGFGEDPRGEDTAASRNHFARVEISTRLGEKLSMMAQKQNQIVPLNTRLRSMVEVNKQMSPVSRRLRDMVL